MSEGFLFQRRIIDKESTWVHGADKKNSFIKIRHGFGNIIYSFYSSDARIYHAANIELIVIVG